MSYPRERALGDDVQDVLRDIATAAGQVQSVASAAAGGTPALNFAQRYKWPLVIGSSLLLGVAVALTYKGARA